MRKIKIITDGICNIAKDIAIKNDIEVIPLKVLIDGVEYLDGIDIQIEEFFEKLKNAIELPKTSQASITQFKKAFETYLDEDMDILYIGGSSKASGTYQASIIAKKLIEEERNINLDNRVKLFDTMNVSIGSTIQVLKAVDLKNDGQSMNEICDELSKKEINLLFYVDTLEYLIKGGRISGVKATVGSLLNLKPLITVKDGLPTQYGVVRGNKKIFKKLSDFIKDNMIENRVVISYGENVEEGETFIKYIKELDPKIEIVFVKLGSVIASHIGAVGLGVSFI